MTEEEFDKLDDQLTAAIDKVCKRAGAEYDYPSARLVRQFFREAGLQIVAREPAEASWYRMVPETRGYVYAGAREPNFTVRRPDDE